MALERSNSKTDWPKSVRQSIFKLRRRVEAVFSQLSEQLIIWGLHVFNKINADYTNIFMIFDDIMNINRVLYKKREKVYFCFCILKNRLVY